MANTVYNGSFLRIKIDGVTVFHETDSEVTMELATVERATKDTDGVEVTPDIISWSASGNSLAVLEPETTEMDLENLFDAFMAKTALNVEFTLGVNGASGDTFYKGTAYLTNLSINATNREEATASWSLTGSGTLEKDTIA